MAEPEKEDVVTTTIRVPKKTYIGLKVEAARNLRSVNAVLVELIENFLREKESAEREKTTKSTGIDR